MVRFWQGLRARESSAIIYDQLLMFMMKSHVADINNIHPHRHIFLKKIKTFSGLENLFLFHFICVVVKIKILTVFFLRSNSLLLHESLQYNIKVKAYPVTKTIRWPTTDRIAENNRAFFYKLESARQRENLLLNRIFSKVGQWHVKNSHGHTCKKTNVYISIYISFLIIP